MVAVLVAVVLVLVGFLLMDAKMSHDPARALKRTKEELLEVFRAGCREAPCFTIEAGRLKCPFCPWINKYFLKKGE